MTNSAMHTVNLYSNVAFRSGIRDRAVRKLLSLEQWCWMILAAIIFEGALRKWLLPSSLQPAAYLGKDLLVLAFVFKHPIKKAHVSVLKLRRGIWVASFLLLPALVVGWKESPAAAVMTLKNAVLWPIFALHLASYLSNEVVQKLSKRLVILAVGMSVLAATQFALPPSHFLNHYAWDTLGISSEIATTVNRGVRATGTFSYISGLSSFAVFGFSWFIWQSTTPYKTRNGRWFAMAGCFACIICVFASGSRSPLCQCALSLTVTLACTRRFQTLLRASLLICLCIVGLNFLPDQSLIGAYFERANTVKDSFESRALEPITWFIEQLKETPLGDGLGQHSQLVTLRSSQEIQTATMVSHEDARARAASEAGVLGITSIFVTLFIFGDLFIRCWNKQDRGVRAATGALGVVVLFQLFSCLWYDHVATALWWFAAGAWISTTVWHTHPSLRASRT